MLGFENSAFGGHANRARLSAALRPDRDLNPGLHRSSLLSLRRIKNLFRFSQQLMKQVERVISLASRRTGLLSMVSRGLGLSFGSQTNELKVVKLFARRTGLPCLRTSLTFLVSRRTGHLVNLISKTI